MQHRMCAWVMTQVCLPPFIHTRTRSLCRAPPQLVAAQMAAYGGAIRWTEVSAAMDGKTDAGCRNAYFGTALLGRPRAA